MAAKLAVSTLSDVRNTMFMSGATPFPRQHWQTLAPAMKQHAELHRKIAGHRPHGPFKHYWGEASRYVGDDNPFSLFLALGVPFEVTGELARDGMTFLSDADARAIGTSPTPGTALLARPQANLPRSIRPIPESLSELFAWKREILPRLEAVPYVEGEVPVVCALVSHGPRRARLESQRATGGNRLAARHLEASRRGRRLGRGADGKHLTVKLLGLTYPNRRPPSPMRTALGAGHPFLQRTGASR